MIRPLNRAGQPKSAVQPHLGAAPRGGRRAPACAARRARSRTTTRGSRRARRRASEALMAPTGPRLPRAPHATSRRRAGEVGEHHPEVEAHERGEREAAAHEHDRVAVGARREDAVPRAVETSISSASGAAASSSRAGSARSVGPGEQGAVGGRARRPPRCRPTACAGTPGDWAGVSASVIARCENSRRCRCLGSPGWSPSPSACITCVLLLLSGYSATPGVLLAVAIAAAINLR